jgi:hypothetical protein
MCQRWLSAVFHGICLLSAAVTPAQGVALDTIPLFDFEGRAEAWNVAGYAEKVARAKVSRERPHAGVAALRLHLQLDEQRDPDHVSAEVSARLPGHQRDFHGKTLQAWLWVPQGARGNPEFPNGAHLFIEDERRERVYGTYVNLLEGGWFELRLRVTGSPETCDTPNPRFDPGRVRKVGLNVSLGSRDPRPLIGALYLDSVALTDSRAHDEPSAHMYTMDAEPPHYPRWSTSPDWQGDAWSSVVVRDGVLVAPARFDKDVATRRKGYVGIVFSPALNLKNTDDARISFDLRFEHAARLPDGTCGMSVTTWAEDAALQRVHSDDQIVGLDHWTRLSFDLRDRIQLRKDPGPVDGYLDLTRLRRIGIQIASSAQFDYRGQVWIDNVRIGGVPQRVPLERRSFVERQGRHFVVDGRRIRLFGANAEYLYQQPDAIITAVLDRARDLGMNVLRTWAFGEGCESEDLQPCEIWSRYYQPSPTTYNERALEQLDRVVAEAGRRELRLILPLVNNWDEYGGMGQYVRWLEERGEYKQSRRCVSASEIHDQFYTHPVIKAWYRDHVRRIVTRRNHLTGLTYAEDPTIMAWELANEPRAPSDGSGAKMHAWIAEMSAYVQRLAPRQLVGTGLEGWYVMPCAQAEKFWCWQSFPANLAHYGVDLWEQGCRTPWGTNGTDFLSDHSDTERAVSWDEPREPGSDSPVVTREATRVAVPAVGYTTMHVYVAPGEGNLMQAPFYCTDPQLERLCQKRDGGEGAADVPFQARNWIAQHVASAHTTLNKPIVLEELGFRVRQGPIPEGAAALPSPYMTLAERRRLIELYLHMAEELDLDGFLLWNLGYDVTGYPKALHQPWSETPTLLRWAPVLGSDAVWVDPGPDPDRDASGCDEMTERRVELRYSPAGSDHAAMVLPVTSVTWLKAGRNRLVIDGCVSGDAREMRVSMRLSDDDLIETGPVALHTGRNRLVIDLERPAATNESERRAASAAPDCPRAACPPVTVSRVNLEVRGYTRPGLVSLTFESIFDNSYVIYPGDPVEPVLREAAQRWAAPTTAQLGLPDIECAEVGRAEAGAGRAGAGTARPCGKPHDIRRSPASGVKR